MVTAINEVERGLSDIDATQLKSALKRWSVGLFISALLGVASGLGGLVIAFLAMSDLIRVSSGAYTTSAILVGASFILFGVGAHCLDMADAADKAIRLETCRQNGLKV
ncbi:MAG TPA: hypothetical protein VMZ26_12650 [Pyrinomonadaceae bacterium]|nr:hypothetical protein [Pyrinomonadaceae bacterium]